MTHKNSIISEDLQETGGLALILRRGAAYLLDIVILFAILAPLGFLVQWLVGIPMPETGPELARTILWNFSIPSWLYFILSDSSPRGATLGKRLVKLQVVQSGEQRVSFLRAVWRTAVKLLPWEMVHFFGFTISADLSQFSMTQSVGLTAANVLLVVFVVLLVVTRGTRSLHDFAAQTKITHTIDT